MTPFDIVNVICEKKGFDRDDIISEYNPFIINKCLSNIQDTVIFANEMNHWYSLDKDQQFDFMLNIIPKGKRFGKWHKKEKDSDAEMIAEYFSINKRVASQYINVLSEEQLEFIRQKMMKGGRK